MRYVPVIRAYDVEKWKYGKLVMQGTMNENKRACIECCKVITAQEFEANQARCAKCLLKIKQQQQAKQARKQQTRKTNQ